MKIIIKTFCFIITTITIGVIGITIFGLLPLMMFDDEISQFYRYLSEI